jgi:putative colanic acid biosysnthesis UDP-glucose lipid carrier transferase
MTHTKKLIQLLFDFLAINTALFVTYFLLFGDSSFFLSYEFLTTTFFVNLLWFATLLYSNRIYTQFEYKSLEEEIKTLIPNYFIYVCLFYIVSVTFFQKLAFSYSIYYGLFFLLLLTSRIFIKFALSHRTLNYITIGYCEALSKIENTLNDAHRGKTNHLGSFGDSAKHRRTYLGSIEDVGAFLEKNKVNMILYVSNSMKPEQLRELMHYAKHNFIEFKIIPLELDYITEGAKFELHHGVFLSAKDEYFAHLRNWYLKRAFDLVFSSLVIVFILSWLFPIICLLIKWESKGSALFIQDRVGFRGRIFKCFKFRSMKVKENGSVVEQAKRNDARVTRVGAFLRKSNLDEMPQFFNVFLGDMSVVGPRPHAVSHDIEFKNKAEEYILRHYMKPGITGWAQVNGWRGPTDTVKKISGRTQCDLWYIRNKSIKLDLKIIFLTVFGSKVKQNVF